MRNEEEIWSEFLKYLPCLFPLVFHYQTTSLNHEEEEAIAIVASFPLSSVCPSRSLAMELLFNRSNKYIPNPIVECWPHTYWVLFSSFSFLCFSWVLLTHILSMTWLAYLLHATVWQRNFAHKEQGTISHHVMSLLLTCSFLKTENQRPFALKKAENEQLGLDNQDTSTLHMQASAHQSVAPTQSEASSVN